MFGPFPLIWKLKREYKNQLNLTSFELSLFFSINVLVLEGAILPELNLAWLSFIYTCKGISFIV